MPGGSGAFGMSYVASSSSVCGSITRTCGGATSDGQTLTDTRASGTSATRTAPGDMAFENATGERPSGPAQRYASVIQVSLWMLLRGFGAMNGLRGAFVWLSWSAVAGAPW